MPGEHRDDTTWGTVLFTLPHVQELERIVPVFRWGRRALTGRRRHAREMIERPLRSRARPDTGHRLSSFLVPPSAAPALMATFTASSIGSLKGTSIRSNPFT